MRTFGVEEELLLVDAATFSPLPAGDRAVQLHAEAQEAMGQRADPGEPGDPSGHEITTEFQQEQFEVAYPPQTTLAAQLETIRAGRALADTAASRVGGSRGCPAHLAGADLPTSGAQSPLSADQ